MTDILEVIRKAVEEGDYCPGCQSPWADCDCDPLYTLEEPDEDD